jgi:hypothetical protein
MKTTLITFGLIILLLIGAAGCAGCYSVSIYLLVEDLVWVEVHLLVGGHLVIGNLKSMNIFH